MARTVTCDFNGVRVWAARGVKSTQAFVGAFDRDCDGSAWKTFTSSSTEQKLRHQSMRVRSRKTWYFISRRHYMVREYLLHVTLVDIPIVIFDETSRVRFLIRIGTSFIFKQFFENPHPLSPELLYGSRLSSAATCVGFAVCLFSLRQNVQGGLYLKEYFFNFKAMFFE